MFSRQLMIKLRIPFILQCLVFLIPVNFYVIGDWMGVGMQWALFRYQQSSMGMSVISTVNDVFYIGTGVIQGRSVIAAIFWIIGASLLVGCFILHIVTIRKQSPEIVKKTSLLTILGALLFILSDMVQYGFLFHGRAGICIPVGIPVIVFVGWWGYRTAENLEYIQEPENELHGNETIPWLNIPLSGISRSVLVNELTILVFLSVFVKIIVFSASLYAPFEAIHADLDLYYHYTESLFSGKLPYIDFTVEYPQLFFIPALVAYIPTLIIHDFWIYFFSFMTLMYIIDAATLVCVYLIAIRLFGQKKAFLCGFLYVTAMPAAFFIPITFDIVPTFFLMFSLVLYVYGRSAAGYLSATAGALAKWFPVFALPSFVLHAVKNRNGLTTMKKGIFLSILFFTVSILPFIVINYQGFLKTYFFHFNRIAEQHSLIYYGDTLARFFFNSEPFSKISLILLLILECVLFFWYYRYLKNDDLTLCYVIFLSIFFFILVNKVFSACFIIWLTPFLALFLINSNREIFLFYVMECIIYIETPLLFRVVYGLKKPYMILENSLPSFSFIFYTIKFAVFFVVFYVILRNLKHLESRENNSLHFQKENH
jgi:hypothetical protein